LLNFLTPLIDKESGGFNIDMEDETVVGTLVTRDGEIVHPLLKDQSKPAAEAPTAEEAPDESEADEVAASAD
jgi:hypothetical protein